MDHIFISQQNKKRLADIRKEYELRDNNAVVSVILDALEKYSERFGTIDLDLPEPEPKGKPLPPKSVKSERI